MMIETNLYEGNKKTVPEFLKMKFYEHLFMSSDLIPVILYILT